MKNFKKSIVLFVVFAMLLGTVAPAFAATASDVVGTNYEAAVGKLGALGVLKGYENGTFKPENNITRAEFAKILCYAVGVQTAADLSKGTTKFSDVPATHWASGYVNIATEKGLLKGYPDATFKPEANVSYAEAVTMLVRALGMGPVVEGKGTWPANYLAKASAAGITEDVSGLVGSAKAIRGNVAIMTWNTLTAEVWGEKEYTVDGVVYGPLTGKTLLNQNYKDVVDNNGELRFVEDATVLSTKLTGSSKDVTLQYDIDTKTAGLESASYDVVADGVNYADLDFKKVDVMFNDDNKVVFLMEKSEDFAKGAVTKIDETEKEITIGGKVYNYSATPVVTVNGKAETFANLVKFVETDKLVVAATALLDEDSNDDVVKVKATIADKATAQYIVDEVDEDFEVTALDGESVVITESLKDLCKSTASDEVVIVKDGKPATYQDIKAGDVVTYFQNAANTHYFLVSSAKVSGKLTKLSEVNGRDAFTVNGTTYKVSTNNAKMVLTGDLDDAKDEGTGVEDLLGKDVTLSLNVNGEVMLINGETKATADGQFAVVDVDAYATVVDGDDVFRVKVVTVDGLEKTLTITKVTEDDTFGADKDNVPDEAKYQEGALVRFEAKADGTVDAEDFQLVSNCPTTDINNGLDVATLDMTAGGSAQLFKDNKIVEAKDGTKYYVNSTTKFMIVENDPEFVTWDDIDTAADLNGAKVLFTSGKVAKYVFITSALSASTDKYGVYLGKEYREIDNDYVPVYLVNQEGSVKEFEIKTAVYGLTYAIETGDLVKFTLDNGDFVFGTRPADVSRLADAKSDLDKVYSVDATDRLVTFTDKNGNVEKLASDAVVYDARNTDDIKVVSVSAIKAGMYLYIDSDASNVKDGQDKLVVIYK